MNDYQIRQALLAQTLAPWVKHPDSLVVEEAGMGGGAVDVLVVSTVLHGYEIKSDDDTLKRLPDQAEAFSATCEFMTLVTTSKHLDKALAVVPQRWGVLLAEKVPDGIAIAEHRKPWRNPGHDVARVIALLWTDELKKALRGAKVRGANRMRSIELQQAFREVMGDQALARAITILKAREGWGIKAKVGGDRRGGPLREVVSRGDSWWDVGAKSKVRNEQLACGHQLLVTFDFFTKLPKKRRCPQCRDGQP